MDSLSDSSLYKVDITNKENYCNLETVDIGFPALQGCKGVSKIDIISFRKECQTFLCAICSKLLEKCPLKYKLVQGASCLSPEIMLSPTLQRGRIDKALDDFVSSNWMSASNADCVKREYLAICHLRVSKRNLGLILGKLID